MKRSISLDCRYYRRFPPGKELGYAEERLELDLDRTVFLIVDVYGVGFDPGSEYGDVPEHYKEEVDHAREIVVDHIVPARAAARAAGLPVVYVTNYLAPSTTGTNEWRNMSIRTVGVDVLETWPEPNDILAFSRVIAPGPGERVIKKQHYSGFFETHLESLLKELDARNLVMVGFDSLICLHGTALDALYRNYRIIVLRDCIGTGEFEETREGGWANFLAVRYIECNLGYTSTAAQFIQACAEG